MYVYIDVDIYALSRQERKKDMLFLIIFLIILTISLIGSGLVIHSAKLREEASKPTELEAWIEEQNK